MSVIQCPNCKHKFYYPTMDDHKKTMSKAAQQLGKLGGQVTVAKHGVEHFKRIAKGWPKGKKRKPR